jgi:hypothetical protein
MRTRIVLPCGLAAVFLLLPAAPDVRATDHFDLDGGFPTELEDAYPLEYRDRALQLMTRYQHNRDGTDQGTFRPSFEVGLFRNFELTIESDQLVGNADRTGSGDVTVKGMYNFNQEGIHLPAFSLEGGIDAPSGKGSEGVDPSLNLLVTKTLGKAPSQDRIHLNAMWKYNAAAHRDERDHLYKVVLGYSRRLGPDALLVFDYVREAEQQRGQDINLLETGIRYSLTPALTLSAGVGFGIGEDSPDVRVTFGFQYSL